MGGRKRKRSAGRALHTPYPLLHTPRASRGFTLIETLVAVSLLSLAIVAPIALTAQSLSTAYYARDQITAYYLAQEGIEVVRSVRDSNVLKNALGQQADLMDYNGTSLIALSPFTVDTTQPVSNAIAQCPSASTANCPALKTDGNVYGYGAALTTTSPFTRYVQVSTISSSGTVPQEIRVSVTVSWRTGNLIRHFTLSEDMYRWVNDGAGA